MTKKKKITVKLDNIKHAIKILRSVEFEIINIDIDISINKSILDILVRLENIENEINHLKDNPETDISAVYDLGKDCE